MKIILVCISFILVFVACDNGSKKTIERDEKGNPFYEDKLNDSIIRRVVLHLDDHMKSVEFENTNSKIVTIYYYHSNGQLNQALRMNTDYSGLMENFVYSDEGKVKQKILKTQDKEKVGVYQYDNGGKLFKKYFCREGVAEINSWVTYNNQGVPDLTEFKKSHYLSLEKKKNELLLRPCEFGAKKFLKADIIILNDFGDEYIDIDVIEGFKRNPELYPFISKCLSQGSGNLVRINLDDLKIENSFRCKVYLNDEIVDGVPSYVSYELYIENLDSIPENNLFPILKD